MIRAFERVSASLKEAFVVHGIGPPAHHLIYGLVEQGIWQGTIGGRGHDGSAMSLAKERLRCDVLSKPSRAL
jgi:hypothetical protein